MWTNCGAQSQRLQHHQAMEQRQERQKSIVLVSHDCIPLIFNDVMQEAMIVSLWLIFEFQFHNQTSINHSLNFIKLEDMYITITNVRYCKYQYYQYGLMVIMNQITFTVNSTAINTIIEIKASYQLIHVNICIWDIQLCNQGSELQTEAGDALAQNVVLQNINVWQYLIFVKQNIRRYTSIVAVKAVSIPENITKIVKQGK